MISGKSQQTVLKMAKINLCNRQLFRERLSGKSIKVHATIPKGSLGHNKYSFH